VVIVPAESNGYIVLVTDQKNETITSFSLPGPKKIETVTAFSLLCPPTKFKRLHRSRYLPSKMIETVLVTCPPKNFNGYNIHFIWLLKNSFSLLGFLKNETIPLFSLRE
jgi:hypothetical protein